MKKSNRMERIGNDMFETLSNESLRAIGGGTGCKLTVSCTFTGNGDQATITDTINPL